MYYRTENPHGGDSYGRHIVLDHSANVNPLGTPPGVLAAAREALEESHRYPDPCCRALVKAIAAYESVPEEWILCGNGASELILSFCAAAGARRAAALAPTFSEYAASFRLFGGETVLYPLKEENVFQPGEDFLPWLRKLRPELVFLCNPNNPTGRLLPPELLRELLDLCQLQGTRLFVDECFLELSEGGRSLKGYLREYPELFLLKAFTKSYGMAGLRLGYCLSADGELLGRMAEHTPPWNVSGPAQAAGVAALGERDFLERARSLIRAERPRLYMALERLGFRVCPSEANYILFHGPESLHGDLLKLGVSIRNCANYPGLGPGWYRVAVRSREENERLTQALRECVKWQKA